MTPLYISVDIEATGSSSDKIAQPDKYSMIAIGACTFGKNKKRFYEEIKPLSNSFVEESMKIACQGLTCLQPYLQKDLLNPHHTNFNPAIALEIINDLATPPAEAMLKFWLWLKELERGRKIFFVADTPSLDWLYVCYYFNYFELVNPFQELHHNLEVLQYNQYDGIPIDLTNLDFPEKRDPPHNALEDAQENVSITELVLRHNLKLYRKIIKLAA